MHPNEKLIQSFYEAFQRRDAKAMTACYAPDVVFRDPAFGRLEAAEATGMWRMLCERGRELEVSVSRIQADDQAGSAVWEARYIFGRPGRRVHNVVQAAFTFRDGKIAEHHDHFDFWRWSRMALGTPGLLLGWTPFLRAAVQRSTNEQLAEFMKKHPSG